MRSVNYFISLRDLEYLFNRLSVIFRCNSVVYVAETLIGAVLSTIEAFFCYFDLALGYLQTLRSSLPRRFYVTVCSSFSRCSELCLYRWRAARRLAACT